MKQMPTMEEEARLIYQELLDTGLPQRRARFLVMEEYGGAIGFVHPDDRAEFWAWMEERDE